MHQLPTELYARYCRIGALCGGSVAATFGLLTWLITEDTAAAFGIGIVLGAVAGA